MKSLKTVGIICFLALLFVGCTSKQQLNPLPSEEITSEQEKKFEANKALEERYNEGFTAGENYAYGEMKTSLEKVAVYLESLRVSALLYKNSAICLPPVMMDKSNLSMPVLVTGKAHICEKFTVDKILSMIGEDIPGMPDEYVNKKSFLATQTAPKNHPSSEFKSIGINAPKINYIPNTINAQNQPKAKVSKVIPATLENKTIIEKSQLTFNQAQFDGKNFVVEFQSQQEASNFCDKNKICQEGK